MDDADFVFSLYKNDLIKVYADKEIELQVSNAKSTLPKTKTVAAKDGIFLYYSGLNISTGVISGKTHDNTYFRDSIGKRTRLLEKYEVDVLGNIRKVQHAIRQTFHLKKH